MLEIRKTSPRSLALRGRLDAGHADRCYQAIAELESDPDLDLAELKYIASAGISVLVRAYRDFSERGQTMTLRNLQPQVKTVMHFSRIESLFRIE
jgi:anti-anti-sigma factor